jgi:hypothetical protein
VRWFEEEFSTERRVLGPAETSFGGNLFERRWGCFRKKFVSVKFFWRIIAPSVLIVCHNYFSLLMI